MINDISYADCDNCRHKYSVMYHPTPSPDNTLVKAGSIPDFFNPLNPHSPTFTSTDERIIAPVFAIRFPARPPSITNYDNLLQSSCMTEVAGRKTLHHPLLKDEYREEIV